MIIAFLKIKIVLEVFEENFKARKNISTAKLLFVFFNYFNSVHNKQIKEIKVCLNYNTEKVVIFLNNVKFI